MITSMARFGALAAVLLALGVAFAAPASAHTRLVSSSPADNAEAGRVDQVSLVFSDRIRNAKVLVKDTAGTSYQSGEARLDDRTVTQPLTGELPAGSYTVVWRVVGEDGHPIQSEEPLTFTVAGGAAPSATPAPRQNLSGGGPANGPSAEAAPAEESSGGARWLMVGSGLLLGLGIGFGFVFLRKGPSSGE
jgi:methionine-rich copper-binding protein CopC